MSTGAMGRCATGSSKVGIPSANMAEHTPRPAGFDHAAEYKAASPDSTADSTVTFGMAAGFSTGRAAAVEADGPTTTSRAFAMTTAQRATRVITSTTRRFALG